jgi:hypothetical protein
MGKLPQISGKQLISALQKMAEINKEELKKLLK